MRSFTVKVEDDAGNVVYNVDVNVDGGRGSEQEHLTDIEFALSFCAPEACPFDCDYCRS